MTERIRVKGVRYPVRGIRDPETKAGLIRRVRTPGGVRHFGQPIGTVIVRDAPLLGAILTAAGEAADGPTISANVSGPINSQKPIGYLHSKASTDWPGYTEFSDGPHLYLVGKERGQKEYTIERLVTSKGGNEDYEVVATAPTKAEAAKKAQEEHSKRVSDKDVMQYPRRRRRGKYAKAWPKQEIVDRDLLYEPATERELREHQEKWGYTVPANAVNVYISRDPSAPGVQQNASYIQVGGKSDGKRQPRQKQAVKETNAQGKWARNEQFRKDVAKVDAELTQRKVNADDTLAVIALMRNLGARIGSGDGDDTRGISQLQLGDVKFTDSGKTATIDYVGKKDAPQHYETDDPLLVGLLKSRIKKMDKGDPTARVFPNTTDKKTLAKTRELTGVSYKNHDYRTLFATEMAEAMVSFDAYKGGPKDKAQLDEWVQEIGELIDEMLNDKGLESIRSYVNPSVFKDWVDKVGETYSVTPKKKKAPAKKVIKRAPRKKK